VYFLKLGNKRSVQI